MDFLGQGMRLLADEDDPPPERWELIFMSFLMVFMFAALITDRVAPDHVFVLRPCVAQTALLSACL